MSLLTKWFLRILSFLVFLSVVSTTDELLGSPPATCATGDLYWAADEGEWWSDNAGADGRLYKCTSPNVWKVFYTPQTYAHPLRADSIPTPTNYSIPTNGAVSFLTTGTTNTQIAVSHARTESSATALAGVALIGQRSNGVLVTEAGVPFTTPMPGGRIYAEVGGSVNTGIAISNPNGQAAAISFYFTNASGTDFGAGSFTLAANRQMAAFLDQVPFNGPSELRGTFTFVSSIPVAAISLRGFINERSEFLISTLPVASLNSPEKADLLPHFVEGGGWTTQVILINPSDIVLTGAVQFFGQGSASQNAQLLEMTVNGVRSSTFSYSIAPHAAVRLVTAGVNAAAQVGSVRIVPANQISSPVATAILSFRNAGFTVNETGIGGIPAGTLFRTYMELSGTPTQPGAIQSGFALANPSQIAVSASLELTRMDGTPVGLPVVTINVPAGGQVTKFINELYPQLSNFRGLAKLTASSNVVLTAVRGRYNERGDFLFTSIPVLNDAAGVTGNLIVPHVTSGLGYSTEIIMFGQAGPGKLYLFSQDGVLRSSLVPK